MRKYFTASLIVVAAISQTAFAQTKAPESKPDPRCDVIFQNMENYLVFESMRAPIQEQMVIAMGPVISSNERVLATSKALDDYRNSHNKLRPTVQEELVNDFNAHNDYEKALAGLKLPKAVLDAKIDASLALPNCLNAEQRYSVLSKATSDSVSAKQSKISYVRVKKIAELLVLNSDQSKVASDSSKTAK